MYDFIDTTEVQEGTFIPSEALKINGEFIENLIDGYRTLYVKGREALSPSLDYFDVGTKDGSTFKNKRYPARIITVGYQIKASDNTAFREAYNKLGGILNVNDAELIFNDELDKYYIGTPSYIDEIEPGKNTVVGEFEITCLDPFKYSVIEYEAEADLVDNTILIDYQGTYKAYPVLEADFFNEKDINDDGTAGTLTGNGDCGFVAFFTEDEQIIQLGDPDELDSEVAYAKSQTLVNQEFKTTSAWNDTAKALWTLNNGCVIPSSIAQAGSLAIAAASYETVTAKDTSGTILNATSRANAPVMNYKVTYKATNRTDNSVKLNISITVALDKDSNYFGRGYALKASIYVGGAWRDVTLKTTSEYWRGKTGHTKNITVTITGLTSNQTSISGIKFKTTRPDGLGTAGLLGETNCSNIAISQASSKTADSYYLVASNYSSGDAWHGPTMIRTLPKDAAGDTGASNFTFTFMQKMSIGAANSATNQIGSFQAHCCDASGNSIAGVRVHKNKAGKTATITYYLNGAAVGSTDIDLSYNNAFFNGKTASKITKNGAKVTFELGGVVKTFTDTAIKDLVATKVSFAILAYGSKKPLEYNGLYYAKFVKNNCNTLKDIPNKFSANDIVEADCSKGEIYLNGILDQSLGALGNDWETFILTPGLNQIGTAYSSWVEDAYKPTMKVRYREVFL